MHGLTQLAIANASRNRDLARWLWGSACASSRLLGSTTPSLPSCGGTDSPEHAPHFSHGRRADVEKRA
ncbi:hypothetical protein GJ744_003728 [Endocarpon pusillum]|uniref:Uncharacterized protein n=1 Tax=Endocarpon pusillum TaxID=364733 RepID=A0A8H7AA90_9EURO|nr:hypothetical protein GJ744_003728 [Endocarpon pusillum]